MGNKIWIGLLGFSALVFAVMGVAAAIWMYLSHKNLWLVVRALAFCGLTSGVALQRMIVRIKFGPKGPPPGPVKDFHVDF